MKTMAISEFKAHALKVINEVEKSQETIVITKKRQAACSSRSLLQNRNEANAGKTCGRFCF